MSGEQNVADGELIAHFLAKTISKSAGHGQVEELELAERISEVELETQILGASFLKVHIIDPELTLINSGWLKQKEGILAPIEVEFPEGSKWKWILCAAEGTTQTGQANLEVTFESVLVAKLREYWGPKQAPPGTRTRAQFVRDLLSEAKIATRIPGLNKVQPVEEEEKNEAGTTVVRTEIEKSKIEGKVNKTPGPVTPYSWAESLLRAGGWPLSKPNIQGLVAWETAEGGAGPQFGIATNTANYNPLNTTQSEPGATGNFKSYTSWTQGLEATVTTLNNGAYQEIVKALASGTSAQALAQAVGKSKWGTIASSIESLVGTTPSTTSAEGMQVPAGNAAGTAESDVAQLTRGTPSNPDEDSFEAITRLASQVDWFAFTSQVPKHPEVFFYMDGPELAKQHPAAYISVQENYCINAHTGVKEFGVVAMPSTFTFDNTTFEYRRTHKVKAKVQRRSKIAKPSTPSEIRLELVCGIEDYRAGDVFVIRGFGPADGRWIVTDATRNCLKDTFTKFILEPPVEPLPEPIATSKAAELTGEASSGVAGEAKKALAEQKSSKPYRYPPGDVPPDGHQAGMKLFGQAPRIMDCSAFASLCYQEAGAPIPGQSGSTLPATNEMIAAMTKTNQPEPGDLCFFGSSTTATTHVTVYVGGGMAISMGQEGDPEEGPAATTGPSGFLGYWKP